MMNDIKRGGRRAGAGRPVTDRKHQLLVRISAEAWEIVSSKPNKAEYIDTIIKKCK